MKTMACVGFSLFNKFTLATKFNREPEIIFEQVS